VSVREEFAQAVNMTPKQLEDWLETDESKAVGQKDGGSESTGHESGRRIVEILRTRKDDLTEDDEAHMRKVVGYVARHTAQRPDKSDDELAHARWTASLKNWGHDPLR
jgi:SpoVK/Ycf46/Vps4 family AAA+-type ATPase